MASSFSSDWFVSIIGHDNELVFRYRGNAVILETSPRRDPGVAAVAEGTLAASAHGGLRLRAGVDHRHNDSSCPGVKRPKKKKKKEKESHPPSLRLNSLFAATRNQRRRLLSLSPGSTAVSCLISKGSAECQEHESYPASPGSTFELRTPVVPKRSNLT